MSATAGQAQSERSLAERLGLKAGQVVQEIGFDDDVDEELRRSVEELTGNELVDEDYEDVVDIVLLWWREEDGDLFEGLTDAMVPLTSGGNIWLLTPKAGRDGHVEPSDIGEAAQTAGLSQTSSVSAAKEWSGTRLVAPKVRKQPGRQDLSVNADGTGTSPGAVDVGGVDVGAEAPDFELADQHGTPVRLSGFRGEKNVVLVFYPLAFSGVCTGELTRLRDEFRDAGDGAGGSGAQLLAVSVDSMFALRAWSDQEGFWFPLLSDFWPHGGTARRYGVFDEAKGLALRGTFIIDTEGVVRWRVVNAIPDARDIDEYREALAGL